MKLDSRILKGEKYLDCFDVDIAEQFIGKKGYFSHYVDNFADLKSTVFGTLGSIEEASRESFVCTEEPFDNYYYEFFLPAEWVKEPEKRWRPYTGIEFAEKFNLKLNSIIHLRGVPTDDHCYNYKVVFTGYRWCDDVFQVFLNGSWLDLPKLLELYEYEENGEWLPFGVLDE